MKKPITEFELIDHGIENSQYFQGCGVAFTDFTDVATGIGNDPAEAIDDALELLTQNDWDTDQLEEMIKKEEGWKEFPTQPAVPTEFPDDDDTCELWYHVSIRVK